MMRMPSSASVAALVVINGLSAAPPSAVDGPVLGIVESVRALFDEPPPSDFRAAVEHSIGSADELVVRLYDGRAVSVVQGAARAHPVPGERVLVDFTPRKAIP